MPAPTALPAPAPALTPAHFEQPRLMAEIGARRVGFALETAPAVFEQAHSQACTSPAEFVSAARSYLGALPPGAVPHAALAMANPVQGDSVQLTNATWGFSIEELRQELSLGTLVVVNDFTALAMALPRLSPGQRRALGGWVSSEASASESADLSPAPDEVMGVLGAGSGLGMSGLVPTGQGWVALGTEGGHAAMAPSDERELAILRFAWRQFEHVSFERLLSGPGLSLIHAALAERSGRPSAEPLAAPEITRRGLSGQDPLCAETLDTFCSLLGTAAGHLALTLGARGGIFLAGRIVTELGLALDASPFRRRFEAMGRLQPWLARIPTWVITDPQAPWLGLSAILEAELRQQARPPGNGLLARLRQDLTELNPAERRVAEQVLRDPRAVLGLAVGPLADAAQVSQPTVIRWCRRLGCRGFADFKLQLAADLSASTPASAVALSHSRVPLALGAQA